MQKVQGDVLFTKKPWLCVLIDVVLATSVRLELGINTFPMPDFCLKMDILDPWDFLGYPVGIYHTV